MTDETTCPTSLVEALSVLQGRLPEIARTHTATVRSDKGAYSYSYAGLAEVNQAVLPLLSELGLAFVCRPTMDDGRFGLAYSLAHVSGEQIDGVYPLPAAGTPQAIGSAISYGRRYVLSALIGVATVDDDDGQAASAERPATVARPARRRTARGAPDETPDEAPPERLSDGQRRAIMAGFSGLSLGGPEHREQRLTISARLAGLESLASTTDLTAEQARAVLAGIDERKRAQAPPAEPTP